MRLSVLDRWLTGRFLRAYVVFTLSAMFLFLTIDLFSNIDSLIRRGLLQAFTERYGTMLPELFFTLSPHLALVSGLWVVVALLRSNELVPLLASGYSYRRLAAPLLVASIGLAAVAWVDRELVLPRLAHLRRGARLLKQPRRAIRPIPDGAEGVLTARWYFPHDQRLQEPRYVYLDADGRETRTIAAALARFEPGQGWTFEGGVVIDRTEAGDRIQPIPPAGLRVPSRILLRDVDASVASPTYLSSAQLQDQLRRTPGFKHLEVQLYERYTQPLAGLALLLAALPIAFGAAHGSRTYLRLLGCLGLSIAFFFMATISYELGSRGVLPPFLAAASPLLAFGALGALLFARTR